MSKRGKRGIYLRDNTYYARLSVPPDVREHFGQSELWKSLQTNNLKVAGGKALPTKTYVEEFKSSLKVIPRTLKQTDTRLKLFAERFPRFPLRKAPLLSGYWNKKPKERPKPRSRGLSVVVARITNT